MTTEANANPTAEAVPEAAADAITSPVIAAAKAALDAGKADESTSEEQTNETEEQSSGEAPEKVELTDEEKAAEEAKAKEGETKEGAPEKYELQFEEGVQPDEATLTEFTDIAKAANLDQETTQKIANIAPKLLAKAQENQLTAITKVVDGWADDTRADKELGDGDKAKLAKTLMVAEKAMQALATPELRQLLNKFDAKTNPKGTGLGNHPEFIRLMYRAGLKISEDKIVTGNEPGATKMSHADRLYGQKKK